MDTPTTDFVHAGSLKELKVKGRLVVHGRIDRYSSSTTKIVSSHSTIAALIWAFRWIAAASRTAP
jgi:prophage tail gpP-like protein